MATVTRVPLVLVTINGRGDRRRSSQCCKCSWMSCSIPETSTYFYSHSLPYYKNINFNTLSLSSSSNRPQSLSLSAAMADSAPLPTVLVTGAGGRTGIFSFFYLFFSVCLLRNIYPYYDFSYIDSTLMII